MTHRLPRTAPSHVGVDAAGIEAFLDVAEADLGLHSFMMARHGQVVAEGWWAPYAAHRLHLGYSLSKMVTASVVGTLVDEGRIRIQDPVLEHLPGGSGDRRWAASSTNAAATTAWDQVTIEHCLTMTVGHTQDAWGTVMAGLYADDKPTGADLLDLVLAVPLDARPGTHFTYNQVATYLLSRVIESVTGQSLLEAAQARLLGPLGAGEVLWHADPDGHHLGFSGVHLTTETILNLAQLYLDEGRWGDTQLLSPAWVQAARLPYAASEKTPMESPDWDLGYGYALWQSRQGYRGDGAYGQFALVLPDHGLAIATTAEEKNMQAVLEAVWTHLLPACSADATSTPAPTAADESLATRLTRLALPAGAGAVRGPRLGRFNRSQHTDAGALAPSYQALSVVRGGTADTLTMTLERHGVPLGIAIGEGEWLESWIRAEGVALPVMASGGWTDPRHFKATVLVIETPHRFEVSAEVSADGSFADGVGGACTLTWCEPPLMGNDPLWLAARTEARAS